MVMHFNSTVAKRCELCHHQTHHVFVGVFDGIKYNFCSTAHLLVAQKNFDEKKQKGLTPDGSQYKAQTPEEEVIEFSRKGEESI